jgi:sirohydrochlorin ferrochelatase/(2Fe-2S) ferredoxin
MDQQAVLIVGHGSREAAANADFEALALAYAQRHPTRRVGHAYVELADPPLARALEDLADQAAHVVAAPLFLFSSGHVKNDLPLALAAARRARPDVRFVAAQPLGVHADLAALAFERAMAPEGLDTNTLAKTALVVVGRGASDPDANADFCKLVRLMCEGRGLAWCEPCFIGITRPLVEETLELVARARPERILIVPYFLFGGRLFAKLAAHVREFSERYPWIRVELGPPLGIEERVLRLLDQRVDDALAERAALPCDNCQYRAPLPGRAEQAGGLRALLWSLRHGFTHAQAAPHVHAHRPVRKHVLVCGNIDCAGRGSVALLNSLRRLLKDAGAGDVRVTRTACMGRCGEGPTVAVYPDGIWYRRVAEHDAGELVREHLLGDRLVARLIDNIMQ